MLNSPKPCSDVPFSWSFDPLTPRDYPDEASLHAFYSATVPSIKLPRMPTPQCTHNISNPEEFFGHLNFTATSDLWTQDSSQYDFDPYAQDMVGMDPGLDLAMFEETAANAVENGVDLYHDLMFHGSSVPTMFDQGPWDEPNAWQPASDCSGYSSSGGQYTCAETSGSSVGFNTPGSSSGDSEAPEPLPPSVSAPERKSVLIPFRLISFFIATRNTVVNIYICSESIECFG